MQRRENPGSRQREDRWTGRCRRYRWTQRWADTHGKTELERNRQHTQKKTSRHTKTGRWSEAGGQRSAEKSGHPNTSGHPEMEHMVCGVWLDPGLGETVAWWVFQAEGFPEA